MIPKVIHYCWFGGKPIPEHLQKCIDSWKKFCPDYEIKRWDESNYDFTKNNYMYQAYQAKKWGFVPDYARLDIVYHHGGIYLDTDVELLKSLDDLLESDCFAGCEKIGTVNLGQGFGAEKGNILIKCMRDVYDNLIFVNDDGSLNLTPSPYYQTEFLKKIGFDEKSEKVQYLKQITIYPVEYFCPINGQTMKMIITKNTYSIHHFDGSWVKYGKLRKFIKKVLPDSLIMVLRKVKQVWNK